MSEQDRFAAAVRKVFDRYVSASKLRLLHLELIAPALSQAPYEAGPPISPLHS